MTTFDATALAVVGVGLAYIIYGFFRKRDGWVAFGVPVVLAAWVLFQIHQDPVFAKISSARVKVYPGEICVAVRPVRAQINLWVEPSVGQMAAGETFSPDSGLWCRFYDPPPGSGQGLFVTFRIEVSNNSSDIHLTRTVLVHA